MQGEEAQNPAVANLLGDPEQYEAMVAYAIATKEAMQADGVGQRLADYVATNPDDRSTDAPTEASEWMAIPRTASSSEDLHDLVVAARFPGRRWRTSVMRLGEWDLDGGHMERKSWRISSISDRPVDAVEPDEVEALAHALTEVSAQHSAAPDVAGRPPFFVDGLSSEQVVTQYGDRVTEDDIATVKAPGSNVATKIEYGYSTAETEAARMVAQQDLLTRMYEDMQLQEAVQ